jgi:hypothetical protein
MRYEKYSFFFGGCHVYFYFTEQQILFHIFEYIPYGDLLRVYPSMFIVFVSNFSTCSTNSQDFSWACVARDNVLWKHKCSHMEWSTPLTPLLSYFVCISISVRTFLIVLQRISSSTRFRPNAIACFVAGKREGAH